MSKREISLEMQVEKTIKNENLIKEGERVLLGLSGGPDSLCLLYILSSLQEKLKFSLKALHVNHKLRGEEADADEAFVLNCCQSLKIPIKICKIDVEGLAKKEHLTLEEAGRKARYAAFFSENFDKIAIAHNKDDQAETVLMRLLRGTGIHGLCAMPYKREDGLIRPLLDISRKQIESYCKENNLQPRIDKTNLEADYTRNKIRLNLIPLLEKEYNPNIKESLIRLSESAAEDDAYLQEEAKKYFLKNGKKSNIDCAKISYDAKNLRNLPLPVLKRVLAFTCLNLGLTEDLAAVHINSMCKALYSQKGALTIQLPKGFFAFIHKGKFILSEKISK